LLFHQPTTTPAAKPPAALSIMHSWTGYPRKKKQNRKINQSLSPVPVENPADKPVRVFLISFFSLITSRKLRVL
jgi:hypothetical protein